MSNIVKASDISWNEGVLRLAAIHDKLVEFRYVRAEGATPETRRFVPHTVHGEPAAANIRFTGEDPDRDGGIRSYRVDRIKGDVRVVG